MSCPLLIKNLINSINRNRKLKPKAKPMKSTSKLVIIVNGHGIKHSKQVNQSTGPPTEPPTKGLDFLAIQSGQVPAVIDSQFTRFTK